MFYIIETRKYIKAYIKCVFFFFFGIVKSLIAQLTFLREMSKVQTTLSQLSNYKK